MLPKKIGLFVLILFIIGSIDSLRNMPAAAMFGAPLIFFFIAAAITFLMPVALISAELSSYHPDKNGIYQWISEAFGDNVGFLGVWLQWINTAIWFPSILAFISGGLAYLIDPTLVHSKLYVVTVILVAFWSMTFLSLKNLSLSASFAALCAVFGFVIPFCTIISLLAVWLMHGNPIQIHIDVHNLLPHFGYLNSWISLTAIFTSFLGMELAAVNVRDIKNPQKNYPIGVIIAATIILLSMIFGSLAIAFVIPQNHISLIAGIFETLKYYLSYFHMTWLLMVMSALVVFASLGEMINWIISPARGLQQAAESGNLPKLFAKSNKQGMPAAVLIMQAVIVTFVCLTFTLFKSVNDIYWLLTDLSTELYLIMYVLMFIAALALHYKHKHVKKLFQLPGGAFTKWLLCLLGIGSCLLTMIIGFIPPKQLDIGSVFEYTTIFGGGIIVLAFPGIYLAMRKKKYS